ncbi:multi-sensor signal transduction histidine kinase [Leptolyngbya sp. Heron Island J]|uniref:ATP-binding protein n=1 Tax=Leptolyngbya sp. Heron Island J TaxID=1385935 RepID=UPI0003B97CD4|nr:ATP-binding protein [Leptolyngbya sp. Heron Island J]ESA34007.1 multi-sensor signal transduction histidine kinase [Leptolyngbya sp. Heron Island J]
MRPSDSLHSPGRLLQDHESFPVHLIDLTQPHGVLMVLEQTTFTITQISENAACHLKVSPQTLLGQPLLDLIEPTTSMAQLQNCLETCTPHPSYSSIAISVAGVTQHFDGLIHRVNEAIIVELEPASLQTVVELTPLQNQVQRAMARLRKLEDITEFLHAAATEIQSLTGYDRVMVYQFDDNNAGEVIAEVKPAEEVSYLGLHYPATDIPALVRQLYQQTIVRFIPDLTASQIELVSAVPAEAPLDLSQAVLRGVDPCCIEYHQNMGVTALLVVALVRNNQLWGLIACHHRTAKFLPYVVRSACEVLGQLVAAELMSKVNRNELAYLNSLQAIQTDFVDSIARAKDFKQALIHPVPRLLEVVSAQGAAICLDEDITLIGNTPALADVRALIDWSMAEQPTEILHTNCLSNVYPDGGHFQAVASGLIVLKISQLRRYLILWFRPEVLQTVNWAGNPHDSVDVADDGSIVLCPRASFEQWKEIVQATALPWHPAELANALALKNAIVGIVLNKADELAQINLELEHRNLELDSFAYAASHDLKEPLRGITNFSNLMLRRYGQTLDESGVKRLKTLVKLAERMDRLIDALLKFSRLGQAELQFQSTDLNVTLSRVMEMLQTGREGAMPPLQIQVPRQLPTVTADPVLITEVLSNLLSNALKYTHKSEPTIEVGYLDPADPHILSQEIAADACVIYVKDDGIGIHERHFQNIFRLFKRLHERDSYGGGTGVGLTIAKKIIERHGGQIWVESNAGEGTAFYFVLSCEEK